MKRKLLIVTAMLAVMVAMTGIAAAAPHNGGIYDAAGLVSVPSLIPINVGETQTFSYRAGSIFFDGTNAYDMNFGKITISAFGTGAANSDITVTPNYPAGKFHVNSSSCSLTSGTTYDCVNPGDITVTLNTYVPGAQYFVEFKADGATGSNIVQFESGGASRTWNSIPEFPTVALPVAAVIGLVFIFQQRKNKKE